MTDFSPTLEPRLKNFRWWQRGIIYQIYPRSFKDSNGDGIGDLAGIRGKLDYLQELGIDAIWISPIYPSPMADFGYDISDYTDIDPVFGTLAEFDALVGDAHRRGLKVLLDYVPNHSSDRHPWFIDARSSRHSAKRHWYIWRDGAAGGGPPNNWRSNFGGSAWQWDEATGQYYYHAFLKEQPDLNWRNPEVRAAMLGVLRFWLDRGVDGSHNRRDGLGDLLVRHRETAGCVSQPRFLDDLLVFGLFLFVAAIFCECIHQVIRGLVEDQRDGRA
jgi:alpha-glucosidase